MIEDKRYYINCPVCGRPLFRADATDMAIRCTKCNSDLEIWVKEGMICVLEKHKTDRNTVQGLVSRSKSYYERLAKAEA